MYDLPASQVAHSARNLDGHVNQVLLRDGLRGNGSDGAKNEQRKGTGKTKAEKGVQISWCDFAVVKCVICVQVLVSFGSKTGVNAHKDYFCLYI